MASPVTQKDTTYTKIFVGGLPYHTTDQSLREFFEQFGDIEEAVVITDRQTGKSRGYGFVTMSDRPAAERACKDPNPIIDGRKANVNLAYLVAKPRGIQTAFPLAIKAGYPGLLPGQYTGMPQYIYPSAYTMANPGMTAMSAGIAPTSPLSPTAAQQLFEYQAGFQTSAAAVQGLSGQYANGLEAAYPYTTSAGFMTPQTAAAYQAYAAMPQQGLPHLAHFQTQQLQERMQ